MLGHQPFSYDLFRKYKIVFSTLFNDIFIVRRNQAGQEVERILVPTTYSAKRAWYARINQDPGLDKKAAIELPMIAYDLISVTPDSSRMLNPVHRVLKQNSETTYNKMLSPIPFDFNFELYVGVKSHEDGDQIMEQINAFFVPDFSITLRDPTSATDLPLSIPIVMGTPTKDESYKTDFSVRQSITWIIPFTMKAWIFGPVRTQGVIREVMVDLLIAPGSTPITDAEMEKTPRNVRITVTPNPLDALPSDAWTYNTVIQDFYDNKKFNPETGLDEDT